MASIYKQADHSRVWSARFRMPDGKWVSRSTKQTDHGIAPRLAFESEGIAGSGSEYSPTGAVVARVIRQIIARGTRCKVETATVGDYLRGWVKRIAVTNSPGTASRHGQIVTLFLAHLGVDGERRNLAAVTPAMLQGFIDAQSATGKSAHTVTITGKILHVALKSALRSRLIEQNPAASLQLPNYAMQEREEFTPADLEALLAAAHGTEWELAIVLGAYCGCRLGDAVTMKWENVDLAARRLSFIPQKTSHGCSRKTIENPLPARLLSRLDALASLESAQKIAFLAPSLAGKHDGGQSGLSLTFRDLMRKAGVAGRTREGDCKCSR